MRAEVYLKGEREPIGHLDGVPEQELQRGRTYNIRLQDDIEAGWDMMGARTPAISARTVALTIQSRSYRLPQEVALRDAEDARRLIASAVPEHAEMIRDAHTMDAIYRWPVLVCETPAIADEIFDLDHYEPAGKTCGLWHTEQHYWAKKDRDRKAAWRASNPVHPSPKGHASLAEARPKNVMITEAMARRMIDDLGVTRTMSFGAHTERRTSGGVRIFQESPMSPLSLRTYKIADGI